MFIVAVICLSGCSAYHGRSEITTRNEIVVLSNNSKDEVSAKVSGSTALEVNAFMAKMVEKSELEKKKVRYQEYEYKPNLIFFLVFPLVMIIDGVIGPGKYDEPYVPGLSRLACFLPLIQCAEHLYGRYVESESQSVRRRWTDTDQTPRQMRVKVEGAGESIETRTDSTGHATVPLQRFAMATLLAGNEQVTLRVNLVK